MAVRLVATLFSLAAVPVSMYILATCTPTLMTDFYEKDPRSEILMIWTAAFFVWDLVICVKDDYGILYILHGASALFVFVAGMKPGGFCHWFATAVIVFESSTPFLHGRKIYFGSIGWNPKRAKAQGESKSDRIPEPPVGKALSIAFAVAFALSRIVFGYPSSLLYLYGLANTILSGEAHSVAVCCAIFVLNLFFCFLNGLWMYQMVAGIMGQDEISEAQIPVTPKVEAVVGSSKPSKGKDDQRGS